MATPHNSAKKKDIARLVLMAGSPSRVKNMAEKYLKNYKLVNDVRGMLTFTGTSGGGKKITIMAHGMGCPSMGIYSYELFKFYDVEKIVRVGTIGALRKDIPLGSIIVAEKSFTKTNYNNFFLDNGASFVSANKQLFETAKEEFEKRQISYYAGNIYCSDNFYTKENQVKLGKDKDLLGVEMESAALYINAKNLKKKALTICAVSDNLVTGEELTAEEREKFFDEIVDVALAVLTKK